MHPSHTPARVLHAQERRHFVMRLRQSGASYRRIARAVHQRFEASVPTRYNARDACRDVHTALRQLQAETDEAARLVRDMELARLDDLQLAVWPAARAGDLSAIGTMLRLMERRARLLNLDRPIKVAQTTLDGAHEASSVPLAMTEEEFALLAAYVAPPASP